MSDLTSSTHTESVFILNNSYIKENWFLWRDLILILIFLSTFCANVSLFLFSYSFVFFLSLDYWFTCVQECPCRLNLLVLSLSLLNFLFSIFKVFIGCRTTELRLRGSRKQLEFRVEGFKECILSFFFLPLNSWTGAFTYKYQLSKSILYHVAFPSLRFSSILIMPHHFRLLNPSKQMESGSFITSNYFNPYCFLWSLWLYDWK